MQVSDELREKARECRYSGTGQCISPQDECQDGVLVYRYGGKEVEWPCCKYRPRLNDDELRALERICDDELKSAFEYIKKAAEEFMRVVSEAYKAVGR